MMTKRLVILVLLLISVFLVTSHELYAQDKEDEIMVFGKRLGIVGDSETAPKYETDLTLEGHNSPKLLELSDSQFQNEIWLLPGNGFKNRSEKHERPPLTAGKIAGSFLSGAVAGGLLGGTIGLIGYALFKSNEQDDISGASGFIVGGIAGYAVGNTLGVFWFGNRGNQTGSYRATILGSVLGVAIGGAGVYLNERVLADPNWGGNDKLSATIGLACPPLFATIGFNLSRRYESLPEESASLVNLRDGQLSFAVPRVYLRSSHFDKSILFQTVDLVRARF
jgi:hypothetical protein